MTKTTINSQLAVYEHALEREKKARRQAENLLEKKIRELYFANQKLAEKNRNLSRTAAETKLLLSISTFAQDSNITFDAVLQNLIDAICELCDWSIGHVFFIDKDGSTLLSSNIWHTSTDKDFDIFKLKTNKLEFKKNIGLPGTILSTGKSAWIEDIYDEVYSPRKKMFELFDIHGAFGAPIKRYNQIIAIIEFFATDPRPRDDQLLKIVNSAIVQLGTMLERRHSEISAEKNFRKLQRALKDLRSLAHLDWLTSIPNRLKFEETLKQELAKAKQNNHTFSLLFIDLDNFKKINDSLGHDFGDKLLQAVAMRLDSQVRAEDFIARLGGDEFAIILKQISAQDTRIVANKLLISLNQPYHIEGHHCLITASIGIALCGKRKEDSVSLKKNADIAMYNAKETGKNKYQIFTPNLRRKYLERLNIETDLHFALKRNEFYLVYQPKFSIKNRNITGIEVLLRWQHSTLGMISPEMFIPIAEETGQITVIGEWVLKTACKQYVQWYKENCLGFPISINISVQQLLDKSFIKTVENILKETHIPTPMLELEITETAAMTNKTLAEKQIRKLHQLGIKIAIDDFGTGYSSLSHLKRLPINTLKIDKSFVAGIGIDENDNVIIQSTIALANNLGLDVIAEGVENKNQLDFLLNRGCFQMQGFYLSAPLSSEQMYKLLNMKHSLMHKIDSKTK